jgi:hypothetical protein
MEDHKWEESATQWQLAYKQVKADRDRLETKLAKIRLLAEKCRRGCECEYDHRCSMCSALISLKCEIFDEETK